MKFCASHTTNPCIWHISGGDDLKNPLYAQVKARLGTEPYFYIASTITILLKSSNLGI
jgi:hypothetical protein